MTAAGAGRLRVAVTLEQCWHRVPGGTATATLGALRSLLAHEAAEGLDLVGVAAGHLRPPPAALTPPIPVRHLPLPRPALYESWHAARWPTVESVTGPVDVIHATAMAVPPRTAPLVVTVHDLAFLDDPSRATARGLRFFRRSIEVAKASADLVVCPSAATAAECEAAGFDPGRVRVVPWGVDGAPATERDVVRARVRHRLVRPYVLWVGTAEPRKNLDGLLAAWAQLGRRDEQLVLVGPSGWDVDVAALTERLDGVRVLGEVPRDELAALYRGAQLCCLPSHREGFGLPVLEAMAQGTPVVTSAGTATAEVGGDAAVLVEPTDVGAIAAGMEALLDDEAERERRSAASLARAGRFSGEATAAGLAQAYHEAAGAPRRRVGVDLLWLVPGEVGGTETYATRVLDAWSRTSPDDELSPVLLANRRFRLAHPELASRFGLVEAPLDGASRVRRVLGGALWMRWAVRAHHLDATHHLGGTAPAGLARPSVLTVHDLLPLSHPEAFSRLKAAYLRVALPRSAARASVVATLSSFVRDECVARLGTDPARTLVVPPGFDPPGRATDGRWPEVAATYGLEGRPYFLYPAVLTYPHKNHRVLIDALAGLADDVVLVLTGDAGSAEPALVRQVADAGLSSRVRRTGLVPRAHLDELYRHAVALVFPSRHEGFGLGVLEAMDLGCPVIAARATSLPEVVGDAGVLLPPDDPEAWRAAMDELLVDEQRRAELVAAGAARAREFCWEDSAEALASAYRLALGDVAAAVGGART